MTFREWKWLRTLLWLSLFIATTVLLISADLSLFWFCTLLIASVVCLYNSYLEFMVSAIFISPLKPKKSAIGEQWSSHYGIHKDVKTHIQVHSTNPNQPLVIFVHGWRSTSASVADRAMWFVEKNWNALLLELPGHGQSSPIHRWNAITSAEHVEYHLRNLSEYISVSKDAPIFLYGHSMGGYLCSRVSSQQSKSLGFNITGVVLESPLMLYSYILEEICRQLRIPRFLRPMHLKRLYRDVKMMHPEIEPSDTLKQFDVPQWGLPNAPTLCLQSMNDNRLGRAHYDALVLHGGKEHPLTHHLIESLPHSGARTNEDREQLLSDWLHSFDSLLL